ncbi:MAG: chloride channel protein [Salinivirgaceae bacterium]|nr:chloride channel protein [Salinivirgaceae bacterium]
MIERLNTWRKQYVSDRQFTLALGLVVGLLAAFAAFVLHGLIRQIEVLLTAGFNIKSFNWLYLVFPVVGIYLTSLFVKYVVKDNISHGITRILYALSRKQSRLKGHNCWSSVIASAITIGFGGSVGAEAPIVLTGSAIGSNLGQMFKLDGKTMMVLVGCGASAAIAGIFKAPMAGVVFTLEVLMIDLTMASLMPILIASVTATCFTYILVGSDSLFHFTLDAAWQVERVPATILLGVFCGLVSLYFIRLMTACEGVFARLRNHAYLKLILGGVVLSSLIFLFPSLYGEGYSSINILLNGRTEADWNRVLNNSLFYGHGDLLMVYIGLVLATKVFATSATNGGGGCGGTCAPSLLIGAFAGFFFSRLWNINGISIYLPEKNFALLGMAGVMAGVMHAPLTGIFLIAEITGGYNLFVPLMVASVSAYVTIYYFEPHSIYTKRLAQSGDLITHNKDRAALTLMRLEKEVEHDLTEVGPDQTLRDLVNAISHSRRNIFPVVDEEGKLMGIVLLDDIRQIMFNTEMYDNTYIYELMVMPPDTVKTTDTMDVVMEKFEKSGAWNLPVIKNGLYMGYISKSKIYTAYRKVLLNFAEE